MAVSLAGRHSRKEKGTKGMNILLTSVGRRTYLVEYFKEALKMAGEPGMVHGANSKVCPAFFAADKKVVTPLIYEKNYIPFLLEYCKKWDIRLLVPLFDIDLPVLASARETFEACGVTVVTADAAAVAVCNDKWKTYRVLTKHRIPTPESWLDKEDVIQAVREGRASYPVMIKPRWGMGSLSVYQADSEDELRILDKKIRREIFDSYLKYEAAQDPANVIIQQKIKGNEFGLDVINDLEGRFRTVVVKKKDAMRAGETDESETMEIPKLARIGEALSGILRHRGNLDVDILEEDGKYYVLEMNDRFGGGYPFSHAAGIHLPYALVMWVLKKEPEEKYLKARAGIRALKDIRMVVWNENRERE